MGRKRYPPLTPSETRSILSTLGFKEKNKEGSHSQWEHPADETHVRAVVTVDEAEREFSEFLIKSVIRQSGRTREEFYGGNETNGAASSGSTREE
jgi:predicted RNA binding protein YcfA (HicA-like mRNA interferase family)